MLLTSLLVVFLSFLVFSLPVSSSSSREPKHSLEKRLQEARNFPLLESISNRGIPDTKEGLEHELETLIFKTIDEVESLLHIFKSDPEKACIFSSYHGRKSVHDFVQFYLALRFLKTSLGNVAQFFFPEKIFLEPLDDSEIKEDRMSQILPSMKLILHLMPNFFILCNFFDSIVYPSGSYWIVTQDSLQIDWKIFRSSEIKCSVALLKTASDSSFIFSNSLYLYQRINRLNGILYLYHLKLFSQDVIGDAHSNAQIPFTDHIEIINVTPVCPSSLHYQFISVFIGRSEKIDPKLLSKNPVAALGIIESLADICEEISEVPFFDRISSPSLLRAIMDTPRMSPGFIEEARLRLEALEKIRREEQQVLLWSFKENQKNYHPKSPRKTQHGRNTTQRKNAKNYNSKKTITVQKNNKNLKTKSEVIIDEEAEAIVADQLEKLNLAITLPTDIHFIRFGQYCYDNVLDQVLQNIPNNQNYTWTMVADYCTTDEGQDLLYKLGLTLRDVNVCIQAVRIRAEKAHPIDFSIEQVQQEDIPALLAYHRNFSPLKHLLVYLNSISEWKKVPGGSLPIVDNEVEENLATPDALLMAAIRTGELCLRNIFEPAAVALKMDPMQSSMTGIIEAAEKYSVIKMPNGSTINSDLLKYCRIIYQLRNKYAHQIVTKEQAIASESTAYNNLYAGLTILKPEFVCKTSTSGQFY